MLINVDMIYPVGSIYMSVNSTNPATLFGGTWELYGIDKFIVGAGNEFAAGIAGGSKTHSHRYGRAHTNYYGVDGSEDSYNGVINYNSNNNYSVIRGSGGVTQRNVLVNENAGGGGKTVSAGVLISIAQTSYETALPPYIGVYIWKRVA